MNFSYQLGLGVELSYLSYILISYLPIYLVYLTSLYKSCLKSSFYIVRPSMVICLIWFKEQEHFKYRLDTGNYNPRVEGNVGTRSNVYKLGSRWEGWILRRIVLLRL